ncbi:putative capsid protein 2 [Acanthamoeba castellanii mimivirus]|uniref:Capsid protein 2 n=4 Tax=Mimivirus TaxID=315393 RepID=W6GF97_MIMIV|nr:probable capsid protein 2 [Acanthamoeba polyphaga mimivirus]AHA45420.1 putative capsid protein 2 [Hirudovirus strain Sangsue]AHJ40126.1 hypothetical protein [Samba virus]ALR84029.1 putative capsid protein 2 [Niemeyer virus]AMZ02883.1 putative capsid protein 2 [Mimivirus Bombay]BAV61543.1 putative capsid protein 2 [Acanthamoeba castellanii mimivirus]
MAGGIIQLAVYGTQDIFLTGSPQITFFKTIYRRHTNFAVESIVQHFIGDINFGQEIVSVVEKMGDLMSRVYLEIDIPKINLVKNSSNWIKDKSTAKNDYDKISNFYGLVYNYISVNTDLARKIKFLLSNNNISLNDISLIVLHNQFNSELDKAYTDLYKYINDTNSTDGFIQSQIPRTFNIINIFKSVYEKNLYIETNNPDEIGSIKKAELLKIINTRLYKQMYDYYIDIYRQYLSKKNIFESFENGTYEENYKFAWVEELGHAIIDYVDIKIGNQVIDKHTGDWFIIFNKLFTKIYQIENYNKMIGNVKELTIFDDKIKKSYKLIIPFQFWFCRNTGLALPLIALRYHEVMFTIKLKELSKVCYVEDNDDIVSMENLQSLYNINLIDAKLYIDYIFLDTIERKRFAQSAHEYLIEVVQYQTFDNIDHSKYNSHLNFSHPTKYIVWFVQPSHYRENPTGKTKCQWNNFGTSPDLTGQPLNNTHLRINSYERTDPNLGVGYYNYVQPYWYFISTPTDGLYVYSFSLKPTEHQPSSTLNLSRIHDFGIYLEFSKELSKIIESNCSSIFFGTYIMSYNILRFMSGMAGLGFQNI